MSESGACRPLEDETEDRHPDEIHIEAIERVLTESRARLDELENYLSWFKENKDTLPESVKDRLRSSGPFQPSFLRHSS